MIDKELIPMVLMMFRDGSEELEFVPEKDAPHTSMSVTEEICNKIRGKKMSLFEAQLIAMPYVNNPLGKIR
jgi:hypothetical protein